jgi:hypothetical protein
MGVRLTDSENVALYDSTTGTAFGPIFESRDDAEAFCIWLGENNEVPDPRKHNNGDLKDLYADWVASLL